MLYSYGQVFSADSAFIITIPVKTERIDEESRMTLLFSPIEGEGIFALRGSFSGVFFCCLDFSTAIFSLIYNSGFKMPALIIRNSAETFTRSALPVM